MDVRIFPLHLRRPQDVSARPYDTPAGVVVDDPRVESQVFLDFHEVEDTDGAFRVFNGRGGMEITDNLRAGCVGMIPAPSMSGDDIPGATEW